MLDQLINLVKENAGSVINNNPAIPADKKEEAVNVTGSSIAGSLQQILSNGGGISEVMKLFAGKADVNQSPVTQQVSNSVTDNLSGKLGIPASQAGGIASSIIPSILGKLVHKTNDPNDSSFNIQDIFNQFSGGKTSGMDVSALLNKFKGGLDRDGDGDVDLNDLASMFGSSGGGGILDRVKGMFK